MHWIRTLGSWPEESCAAWESGRASRCQRILWSVWTGGMNLRMPWLWLEWLIEVVYEGGSDVGGEVDVELELVK